LCEFPQKAGDAALARLINGFMPYIRRRAGGVRIAGLDTDDLVQEGLIGLFRAIETYDSARGAAFSSYAISCINNRISNGVKQAARKKHLPLNTYVPLEDGEDFSPASVRELLPEAVAIANEEYAVLRGRIDSELSRLERKVLALHLEGFDNSAAALRLGLPKKSVDNALRRARSKLKSNR
jgi:RNA polymerase sporulation-specific sigma factor